MIKNNKGVTLISLVVTILVLGILAGVSLTAGTSVITQVRAGRIVSNMSLVKAKAQTIYEEYQFYNNDISYLAKADEDVYFVGTMDLNVTQEEIDMIATEAGVTSLDVSSWEWYKWDKETLESQGLDKQMLGNNECFFVNYEYGEIIFSEGTSYHNSVDYYSLTGVNYVLKNS